MQWGKRIIGLRPGRQADTGIGFATSGISGVCNGFLTPVELGWEQMSHACH
jgi:hypothetical protein